MTRRRLILAALLCLLAVAVGGLALAQSGLAGARWRFASPLDGIPADRAGVPDWKVDEQFKDDVFTFVRVQYDSYGGGRLRRLGPAEEAGRPTGPTATSTSPTASSSSPRSRSTRSRSRSG